jgi:predicted nucleic acid-binding protein
MSQYNSHQEANMTRIKKLTPRILRKIIKEEKAKISKTKTRSRKKRINENAIDSLAKLTLKEVKVLLEAKRIRKKREALKRAIAKKMK